MSSEQRGTLGLDFHGNAMPTMITEDSPLNPGEIYEDGFFHPCFCMGVEDGYAWGISLIDGSHPRTTELEVGGIRRLSIEEAWIWKSRGPEVIAKEEWPTP